MKKSHLARNIRKLRSFKNLNQTDFAELFDLTRPALAAYEEGRAEPKLITLNKLASYFALSLDELINQELTVNQIAHFNTNQPGENKIPEDITDLLSRIDARLSRLEAGLKLINKKK